MNNYNDYNNNGQQIKQSVSSHMQYFMRHLRCAYILSVVILLIDLIGPNLIPFTPSILYASTNVSGNISVDTTWTKAGSPYIITSDVYVYTYTSDKAQAPTLTIEPGVEIRFDPSVSLLKHTNQINK